MNVRCFLDPLSVLAFLVAPVAAQDPAQDAGAAATEVREMIAAYAKAREEHAALVDGAAEASPEERRELARKRPSATPVIEKAQAFIEEAPEHEVVPEVAEWLLEYQRSGTRSAVYEVLTKHHLGNPGLAAAVLSAMYDVSEEASDFLRTVMDNSTEVQARAAAAFALGYRMRNDAEEAAEERLVYLRAAVKDVGDLELRGRSVKAIAEAQLYEVENLGIGMLAPEIEGKDTSGVAFQLSDYQGKVVVLEFWGHWCGPCRAVYLRLRSLVSRMSNEPFALIGVNSDPKVAVRDAMKEENLGWRSFWDGGTAWGPIARQWGVTSWPTVYILDGEGVIRFKDLWGSAMEDAVHELLGEIADEQGD